MSEIIKRDNIRAIILDMDGVLVNSEPIQMEAFRCYLEKYDIPYTEELLRSFIGVSVEENLKTIQASLPDFQRRSLKESITERNAIYIEQLEKQPLTVMPGIDDIINCCLQNKILLGLATSSPFEQVNAVLTKLQGTFTGRYMQLFNAISHGGEVTNKKPAPDIYHLICKKLNVKSDSAVSVEDSPAGVQSARRAGLIAIGIPNSYYSRQDLAAAHIIVDSAKEILFMMR